MFLICSIDSGLFCIIGAAQGQHLFVISICSDWSIGMLMFCIRLNTDANDHRLRRLHCHFTICLPLRFVLLTIHISKKFESISILTGYVFCSQLLFENVNLQDPILRFRQFSADTTTKGDHRNQFFLSFKTETYPIRLFRILN